MVRQELHRQGVWNRSIENKAMRIIHRESGGREWAKSRSGKYVGLFQFGKQWGGNWRYNGRLSIRRFVRVYKAQGMRGVRRHWRATY